VQRWLNNTTSKLLEKIDAVYETKLSIGDNNLNWIKVAFTSKTPPKICFTIYGGLEFVATRAEKSQVSLRYLAWKLQTFDHKLNV